MEEVVFYFDLIIEEIISLQEAIKALKKQVKKKETLLVVENLKQQKDELLKRVKVLYSLISRIWMLEKSARLLLARQNQ